MNTFVCPDCHGRKTDQSGTTLCLPCLGTGVLEDVRLSKHFTLAECVRSEVATRRAIPNMPTPEQVENLRRVCLIADLVRDEFGPVRVNSGFRSRNVNALVGGTLTSAHVDGRALDLVTLGVPLRLSAAWIAGHLQTLDLDQLIYEGTWLHLGIAKPGTAPRRQALMMFGGKYEPLDVSDPRVV